MDSSDEFEEQMEEVAAAVSILSQKNRTVWVHEVNKTREAYGEFHTIGK